MPTAEPLISEISAHLLTAAFAGVYVGSLYVSKSARLHFSQHTTASQNGEAKQKEPGERWRDDPYVIKARLIAVSLASFVCSIAVFITLWRSTNRGRKTSAEVFTSVLLLLGLHPRSIFQSIFPHFLTPLLFIGPLYSLSLSKSLPFQRRWNVHRDLLPVFTTWIGIRNYLFAPITEEFVFRACVIGVYHLSGASKARMIFLSPLSFGAAHIHHAWETYNQYGRTLIAAKRAIAMSLFQFTYTTLFGFHCAFLFIRTGSLLPPISAHIFCNIMGVPRLGLELEEFPHRRSVILTAYLTGIFAFIYKYQPWTKLQGSIYWQG